MTAAKNTLPMLPPWWMEDQPSCLAQAWLGMANKFPNCGYPPNAKINGFKPCSKFQPFHKHIQSHIHINDMIFFHGVLSLSQVSTIQNPSFLFQDILVGWVRDSPFLDYCKIPKPTGRCSSPNSSTRSSHCSGCPSGSVPWSSTLKSCWGASGTARRTLERAVNSGKAWGKAVRSGTRHDCVRPYDTRKNIQLRQFKAIMYHIHPYSIWRFPETGIPQ